MKWTPEQREDIERQKLANPGSRRIHVTRTPEQIVEWRALAEAESSLEAIAANREHYRKLVEAEAESGFSGDLRRAISKSRKPIHELAATAGIDVAILEGFRCGDTTLPTDVVDRIVQTLQLRLTETSV
jgi:hypothetical protein